MKHEKESIILPFHTVISLKTRIGWFVNLRWIAIFGVLAAIPMSQIVLRFNLAYSQIFLVVTLLMGLNVFYFFLYKYYPFSTFRQELAFTEVQVVIDFIIISFVIHFIGGITNPFYFFYIVHIIISGILFQKEMPWINALFSSLLLTAWTLLEHYGLVQNYYLTVYPPTNAMIITSLMAFYLLIFTTTYVIKDFISKYRSLKLLMDKKNELLEKTMAERDKMFRFTAHELKSPLTTLRSILGVVKLLNTNEKEREKVQELLCRAEVRSDQLLAMVNDMIDITNYKHGKKEVKPEQVDFDVWLAKITEGFNDLAANDGVKLKYMALNKPSPVIIDIKSMEKIANNLISNAIRYTEPDGEVVVRPYVNRVKFGFSVKDTGIGITPDELEKIFQDFYRSKSAKQKSQIGTGLGLSLVKQIVEKYNGEITVKSQINKGSEFTVSLPKTMRLPN